MADPAQRRPAGPRSGRHVGAVGPPDSARLRALSWHNRRLRALRAFLDGGQPQRAVRAYRPCQGTVGVPRRLRPHAAQRHVPRHHHDRPLHSRDVLWRPRYRDALQLQRHGLPVLPATGRRDYPIRPGRGPDRLLATVIGALLADFLYALADPRIRLAGRSK